MSVYPTHLDVDAVLRDGSTVHVRPARIEDRDPLRDFLAGLSEESRIMRFFGQIKDYEWALDRFLDIDYARRHGLVGLTGSPQRIVGHGFYAETGPHYVQLGVGWVSTAASLRRGPAVPVRDGSGSG